MDGSPVPNTFLMKALTGAPDAASLWSSNHSAVPEPSAPRFPVIAKEVTPYQPGQVTVRNNMPSAPEAHPCTTL
eukprot:scaffold641_cov490-Prasinococcus_capsulatus_cf.AAC.11